MVWVKDDCAFLGNKKAEETQTSWRMYWLGVIQLRTSKKVRCAMNLVYRVVKSLLVI